MSHKFQIGDLVRLKTDSDPERPRGVCEVSLLLSVSDDGEPVYQVRSAADGLPRVVREKQIAKA